MALNIRVSARGLWYNGRYSYSLVGKSEGPLCIVRGGCLSRVRHSSIEKCMKETGTCLMARLRAVSGLCLMEAMEARINRW